MYLCLPFAPDFSTDNGQLSMDGKQICPNRMKYVSTVLTCRGAAKRSGRTFFAWRTPDKQAAGGETFASVAPSENRYQH